MLSVIIPTYNECANLPKLTAALIRVLNHTRFEILFVDDSIDDTFQIIQDLAKHDPRIRWMHRHHQRGLATAVVLGFAKAKGDIVCVMDGDLQHPPELLPEMLAQINSGADLVVPSRFLKNGNTRGLTGPRKIIAMGARALTWFLLPKSRWISDPLSGFFMVRRTRLQEITFNPTGWKILLEVLVKGHFSEIVEVPYCFEPRCFEASKMSGREQLNFLRHLLRLIVENPVENWFWRLTIAELCGLSLLLPLFTSVTGSLAAPAYLAVLAGGILLIFPAFTVAIPPVKTQVLFRRLLAIRLSGIAVLGSGMLEQSQWTDNDVGLVILTVGLAVLWNHLLLEYWVRRLYYLETLDKVAKPELATN